MFPHRCLSIALFAVAAASCGPRQVAAPPAKVVFENALFRILDAQIPSGTTLTHSAGQGMTTIAMLDGARIRIQAPGGKFGEESQPAVGAINVGEAGEHVVQNTGETPFQLFALDRLRPHGQSAPPPGNTSMTVAAESPSFRVLEATLTDKNTQITHIHPVPAVTVLVSGKVLSQGPESKEADIGQAPTGLKQLDQRAQWLFVPAGGSHYLVRLGTEPAHVIEIELR